MSLDTSRLRESTLRFIEWLDQYGETSFDHQTFFAGPIGGPAKALYYRNRRLGTLAVAPMILCEAFLPEARRLFWKRQRFPIADAHYAGGFAFLAGAVRREPYYSRAVHFLEVLIATRARNQTRYCWGYPFDWVTMKGTIPTETPLITTVPYVYEAFRDVHKIDREGRWLEIMRSIADHGLLDYRDFQTSSNGHSTAYSPLPDDAGGVVNASAYRAWMLTAASVDFEDDRYRTAAEGNLHFVLEAQNADGSWFYSTDGKRDFVDHFHTCFVLKALAKIETIITCPALSNAIDRGLAYYADQLFDGGLPKPFSRAPRMTVYRRELYDYAECINLATLVRRRNARLDALLPLVVNDVLARWQQPSGCFRARQLLIGWDNVPMHRWAQAQMFRSLSQLLARSADVTVSTDKRES
jgi:hypothetical protein